MAGSDKFKSRPKTAATGEGDTYRRSTAGTPPKRDGSVKYDPKRSPAQWKEQGWDKNPATYSSQPKVKAPGRANPNGGTAGGAKQVAKDRVKNEAYEVGSMSPRGSKDDNSAYWNAYQNSYKRKWHDQRTAGKKK